MDEAQLDQQVQQALQELGETASVESVARTIRRRTSDVLEAIRRVTGTSPATPDANLPPELYPTVVQVAAKVAQLGELLVTVEAELAAAEQAYTQVETQAADAVTEGFEPTRLHEAQQRVHAAAERQHLLMIALARSKERHAEALAQAQARQWQAQWRQYQMDIAAFDATLAEAYEAQQAVLASWNHCGQPGEAPVLKAPLAVWKTDFHAHLLDLVATPPEAVQRGAVLTTGGMPRGY